jgi:hypothetical protein
MGDLENVVIAFVDNDPAVGNVVHKLVADRCGVDMFDAWKDVKIALEHQPGLITEVMALIDWNQVVMAIDQPVADDRDGKERSQVRLRDDNRTLAKLWLCNLMAYSEPTDKPVPREKRAEVQSLLETLVGYVAFAITKEKEGQYSPAEWDEIANGIENERRKEQANGE